MKTLLCWIGIVAFLYLAITAFTMHDYGIAAGMGGIAVLCLIVDMSKPSKTNTRKKSDATSYLPW